MVVNGVASSDIVMKDSECKKLLQMDTEGLIPDVSLVYTKGKTKLMLYKVL